MSSTGSPVKQCAAGGSAEHHEHLIRRGPQNSVINVAAVTRARKRTSDGDGGLKTIGNAAKNRPDDAEDTIGFDSGMFSENGYDILTTRDLP